MMLTQCPVCAGDLSPAAFECPLCGHPLRARRAPDAVQIALGVASGLLLWSIAAGAAFVVRARLRPGAGHHAEPRRPGRRPATAPVRPGGTATGEAVGEARRLAEEGRAAQQRGEPDDALRLYEGARALLTGEPPPPLLADVLRRTGTVHCERGCLDEAERWYQRSMEAAERAGHVVARAHGCNCLGIVAQRRGKLEEAEDLFREAARLAEETGETRLLAMVQLNRGIVADIRGEHEDALCCWRESLEAFEAAGDEYCVCEALNNMGILHCRLGEHDRAEEVYARGIALARARQASAVEGILEANRAEARIGAGRLEDAEAGCAWAYTLAQRRGDPVRMAEALRIRALMDERQGRLGDALAALDRARELAEPVGDPLLLAEVLRETGEVWRRYGEAHLAREAWHGALSRFRELGARADAADVETRLAALAA
ncbi:MAG TPA: tetratricopeptide repeat protein [Longimicrobium sp.]|jgi:tetratricopeptide (TPR) repeat protein